MKKMKTLLFVFATLISSSMFAQKLGHINSNELLQAMPERAKVEDSMKTFASNLEDQLSTMTKEYQAKVQNYQSKQSTMTESIKKDKIQEITNLEDRINKFQQSAQEDLKDKEQSMLKPIIEKAKNAIDAVAKEGGYLYIFDSGVGALLYEKDSQNIMTEVKKKLGLL